MLEYSLQGFITLLISNSYTRYILRVFKRSCKKVHRRGRLFGKDMISQGSGDRRLCRHEPSISCLRGNLLWHKASPVWLFAGCSDTVEASEDKLSGWRYPFGVERDGGSFWSFLPWKWATAFPNWRETYSASLCTRAEWCDEAGLLYTSNGTKLRRPEFRSGFFPQRDVWPLAQLSCCVLKYNVAEVKSCSLTSTAAWRSDSNHARRKRESRSCLAGKASHTIRNSRLLLP